MQLPPSFPPEVYQAARARGLDLPVREYHENQTELKGRAKRGGKRGSVFRAWDCSNGLVYQQDTHFQAMRWEQLATVTRQTAALYDWTFVTIRYVVQPEGAPAFDFTILGNSYAGLITPQKERGSRDIKRRGVRIRLHWRGGVPWITSRVDLSAYAGLGELLEAQLVSHRLPGVLEAYQGDSGVAFGSLVASRQGITDGTRMLLWQEISGIGLSLTALQIAKQPAGLVCFEFSLLDLPNVALLEAFLTNVPDLQSLD